MFADVAPVERLHAHRLQSSPPKVSTARNEWLAPPGMKQVVDNELSLHHQGQICLDVASVKRLHTHRLRVSTQIDSVIGEVSRGETMP